MKLIWTILFSAALGAVAQTAIPEVEFIGVFPPGGTGQGGGVAFPGNETRTFRLQYPGTNSIWEDTDHDILWIWADARYCNKHPLNWLSWLTGTELPGKWDRDIGFRPKEFSLTPAGLETIVMPYNDLFYGTTQQLSLATKPSASLADGIFYMGKGTIPTSTLTLMKPREAVSFKNNGTEWETCYDHTTPSYGVTIAWMHMCHDSVNVRWNVTEITRDIYFSGERRKVQSCSGNSNPHYEVVDGVVVSFVFNGQADSNPCNIHPLGYGAISIEQTPLWTDLPKPGTLPPGFTNSIPAGPPIQY